MWSEDDGEGAPISIFDIEMTGSRVGRFEVHTYHCMLIILCYSYWLLIYVYIGGKKTMGSKGHRFEGCSRSTVASFTVSVLEN